MFNWKPSPKTSHNVMPACIILLMKAEWALASSQLLGVCYSVSKNICKIWIIGELAKRHMQELLSFINK